MPRANKGAFVQPGQGFGVAAAAVFFLNQGKQAAGWKSRASLIREELGEDACNTGDVACIPTSSTEKEGPRARITFRDCKQTL